MIQVHRLRKAPLREETERRLGQDGSGLHPPGHATYDRAGQYRSTRQERSYGRNPWHRSELSPPSCRASEPATISRSRNEGPARCGTSLQRAIDECLEGFIINVLGAEAAGPVNKRRLRSLG